MTEVKILGTTQKVVYAYLKEHPCSSAYDVGDALYKKTSSCAKYGDGSGSMGGRATDEERRTAWAAKAIKELDKKGLLLRERAILGSYSVWSIKESDL